MGGRAASGGGVAGSSFATLDTEGASPAASASSGHPKLGGELEGRGAGGAQGPRAARPAALGSRRFSRPLSVTDQQSAPASIGSTPPSRQPSMQVRRSRGLARALMLRWRAGSALLIAGPTR